MTRGCECGVMISKIIFLKFTKEELNLTKRTNIHVMHHFMRSARNTMSTRGALE